MFVDRHRMCSTLICPTRRKLDIYPAKLVGGSVLHLDPSELTASVGYQIERAVFGLRRKDGESLLEQINLSLQDTQISLAFGVVRRIQSCNLQIRENPGFHGVAISTIC